MPLSGQGRQVPAEVIQRRRLRLLLGAGNRLGLAPTLQPRRHVTTQQSQSLGPRLLQVDPCVGQNLSRNPLLLPQQAEEQVFGTDVGMIQLPGLTHRKLQYLLGSRGIREIGTRRGRRLPLLDRLLDPLLDLVQVHIQVGEHCGRHTLPFAYQPEENVLRTNVFVVQTGGFFSRHLQNLANSVGEVVTVHSISRVIVTQMMNPIG